MKRSPLYLACLLPSVFVIANCGTGPVNRQLESLSIDPATASANGSAVQFTATGYWNTEPTTVTPQSATWGACTDAGATSDVTVSTTGLAACASGAKGKYTVFAWDYSPGTGARCNVVNACGGGCGRIAATAQLTCP